MAEVRSSGPQICQWVIYQDVNTFYPAIIVMVDRFTGLVRLTTLPAGGATFDHQDVPYDPTGANVNSWRYPDIGTGI